MYLLLQRRAASASPKKVVVTSVPPANLAPHAPPARLPHRLSALTDDRPIQRRVYLHSEPPLGASNGTYVAQSISTTSERTSLEADVPLMTAVNARQPTTGGVPGMHNFGKALRHVISYDSFLQDAVAQNGNPLNAIRANVLAAWPPTSVIPAPGAAPPVVNNAHVQALLQQWIEARHHDPANLFWGDSGENAAIGAAYDNPARARAFGGGPGSALDTAERDAQLRLQVGALVGGAAYAFAQKDVNLRRGAVADGPITTWLRNNCGFNAWPVPLQNAYVNVNTELQLYTFLKGLNVYPRLTLTRIFRNPANRTGPV